MAKPIDPENEKQLKANKVVAIIHGGDSQEYEITEKHPLIKGNKEVSSDPRVKTGDLHWAHPTQVDRWEKRGWVKKTSTPTIVNKMPQPEKE